MNYCFIIPCYNHDQVIEKTISDLQPFQFPIILVNDGSRPSTQAVLSKVAETFPLVTLINRDNNGGKGAAMQTGLKFAVNQGFSHAIQVDADGQHNLDDIPKLIATSTRHPQDLVSGKPVYDDSISAGRYYGRFITHFWVAVETLSFRLIDSMCGFRVYPLAAYQQLTSSSSLGMRMDFDIEVLVKLMWQGVNVRFIDTQVHYPEGGVSHFHAFKDNILISKMHARLFFGMLLRLPKILANKINH